MTRNQTHSILLSTFAFVVALIASRPAAAQDAKQPYPSMAPVEQYLMDPDAEIALARSAATGRPLDILLWCVQAFLALVFVSTSWAKLMGKPEMVALFTAVGFGQWFR